MDIGISARSDELHTSPDRTSNRSTDKLFFVFISGRWCSYYRTVHETRTVADNEQRTGYGYHKMRLSFNNIEIMQETIRTGLQ